MRQQKAISYLRFSTKSQGKAGKDSTRRQMQMAIDWCDRNKVELDDSIKYHDLGASAYRGKNADKGMLAAILTEVQKPDGRISRGDYILLENVDRLSRSKPLDSFELVKKIVDAGLTIVTLADGMTYNRAILNSDQGRMYILLGAIMSAHNFSKSLSIRIQAVQKRKRGEMAEGHKTKHMCPAWLDWDPSAKDYRINDLAPMVKEIWLMRAGKGIGISKIVQAMQAKYTYPKSGRSGGWTGYVSHILSARAVTGERTVYETVNGKTVAKSVIPDYYPALLTVEQYDVAKSNMENESFWNRGHSSKAGTDEISNLFTGKLYCSLCGGKLTIHSCRNYKKETVRYAICKRKRIQKDCDGVSSRLDLFEDRIIRHISQELRASDVLNDATVTSEIVQALHQADLLQRRIDDLATKADGLAENMADSKLSAASKERLITSLNRYETEIEASRKLLADAKIKASALQTSMAGTEQSIAEVKRLVKELDDDHPEGETLASMWAEITATPHPMQKVEITDRTKMRSAIATLVDSITLKPDSTIDILFKSGVTKTIKVAKFIRSGWGEVVLLDP